MLGTAIALAARIHEPQKDKGGKPYILHPLRLMMRLRCDDEELMSIAVLHDVVEDSEVTISDLTDMGFSKRVTDALFLLTHMKGDSYEAYIRKIGTSRDATLVKLEDLRDNSDITRLKGLTEKDHARLMKYNKSFVYLMGVMDLWKKTEI
jgi:(p)ppGpp synthase/HD superfamily hydrolase